MSCFLQKISPVRIHKIYVLNMMSIAETVVNLAKTVMKKKIFDRVNLFSLPVVNVNLCSTSLALSSPILPVEMPEMNSG